MRACPMRRSQRKAVFFVYKRTPEIAEGLHQGTTYDPVAHHKGETILQQLLEGQQGEDGLS